MRRRRAVKVIGQRHEYDCGTACLSMLLEVSYGDAAAAVRKVTNAKASCGTDTRDLQRAARLLGHRLLTARRKRDVQGTGILGIEPETATSELPEGGHWCILRDGVVIDTDQTVWSDAREYLKAKRAKPVTLLVVSE